MKANKITKIRTIYLSDIKITNQIREHTPNVTPAIVIAEPITLTACFTIPFKTDANPFTAPATAIALRNPHKNSSAAVPAS